MTGVDMQIVNVALPILSRDFSAPLSDVQWTVISYLAATILAALGTIFAWTLINTGLASSTMTGGTSCGRGSSA
jgi:hypothetical protein